MIKIDVPGLPAGQGNHRRSPAGGIYETSQGHGPWRDSVIWAARQAWAGAEPWTGAVQITVAFVFPRPKSHYGTGKNAGKLKDGAPLAVTVKPDLDKLQRSIGDALKLAGCLREDSQIAHWDAAKVYGAQPGAFIEISRI